MRILIANHQSKMRFALRVTLERHPGLKTIGEASDAEGLLAQARAICPDLAIVDWGLPGMPMGEVIGLLRRSCSNSRVIILGSRAEMRAPALATGTNAFICMCDAPEELMSAMNRCLKEADE